jgi:hypothetical protein
MRDINFFSESTYLSIPNRKNPKVILAIGNTKMAKNSFEIYNPFSLKAKVFKRIVRFLCVNFNSVFLRFLNVEEHKKSEFINFLNDQFQVKFTASIYNATLKDKVVVQLQTKGAIFGYVKFPINEIGLKNITNEIRAIQILSKERIMNLQMQCFEFKDTPFFILPDLQGNFENIPDKEVLQLIESYKKDVVLELKNQPRILEIKDFFVSRNLKKELSILNSVIQNSKEYYHEAYEHGDFAPWNIVKTKEGLAAFDFEYFTEKGVEYFDLIKYHFQVGRLLKGKSQKELYSYISEKIRIQEIKEILSLFLLKEIMNCFQQEKTAEFESQMLTIINE